MPNQFGLFEQQLFKIRS